MVFYPKINFVYYQHDNAEISYTSVFLYLIFFTRFFNYEQKTSENGAHLKDNNFYSFQPRVHFFHRCVWDIILFSVE